MAYVHSVPGRLRVKCPTLRGNDRLGLAARNSLSAMPGVEEVRYNPRAHCLTVTFDPALAEERVILAHLRERGIAAGEAAGSQSAPAKARPTGPQAIATPLSGAVVGAAASAVGGAFGRAIFGAVIKTSLERGVATLVTSAIR